ncbi:hypothetical protein BDR07DRAFT_1445102, partial [Suillus spraguei]
VSLLYFPSSWLRCWPPLFASMNEMVSCYTAAVKKTRATGPYAIAGHRYRCI